MGHPEGFDTDTINWNTYLDDNGVTIVDDPNDNGFMALSGFSIPGDINNDGIDDLLIMNGEDGTKKIDGVSSLNIIYGDAQMPNNFSLDEINGVNGAKINLNFGQAKVGAAGDINGNGITDFVISEYSSSEIFPLSDTVTYVVYGNCDGYSHNMDLSDVLAETGGVEFPNAIYHLSDNSTDLNKDGNNELFLSTRENSKANKTDSVFIVYSEYVAPGIVDTTICQGESVQIGDEVFTETGNYTILLTNQYPCDSTIHLSLTVNTVDVSVTLDGNTISANTLDADSYQWYNCTMEVAVEGEISSSFTVVEQGEYAVIIEDNNCVDTSACNSIITTDIEHAKDLVQSIYPNPSSGRVNIQLAEKSQGYIIEVLNMTGLVLFQKELNSDQVATTLELPEGSGVFFIRVHSGSSTATYKIIRK